MRVDTTKHELGFPKASPGFATGGINCWDDLEDSTDTATAKAVDVAVDALEQIHRKVLGDVFILRFRAYDPELVEAAARAVWHKMSERGIV